MDLTSYLHEEFNLKSSSPIFKELYSLSIWYITGQCSAFEYQRFVKPYCTKETKSAKNIRLGLLKHKEIYFRLKLFALRYASSKLIDVAPLRREIGISLKDSRLTKSVIDTEIQLARRLRKVRRDLGKDAPLDEQYFDSELKVLCSSVIKYIKTIVWRKLRFVAKSSNFDLQDLHQDLLIKVIQAYYQVVPTVKSYQHIMNYLCRTAHNHAMNLINTNTSQKRGRLVNVGVDNAKNNIFTLLVTSENQLNASSIEGEEVNYENLSSFHPMEKFELEFSVSQVLDGYKRQSRKHRLLLLLMGAFDLEFTEWLRERNLIRIDETNEDLQARCIENYKYLCMKFLKVGEKRAESFLKSVGKKLGYERTEESDNDDNRYIA